MPFPPHPDGRMPSAGRMMGVDPAAPGTGSAWEMGCEMTGRSTGKRGKGDASAALDAAAEALILVDPADPSTYDELLGALQRLAQAAPRGTSGDAARAAVAEAVDAVGRLTRGEAPDTAPEFDLIASRFETARAALTKAPALERSKTGGDAPAASSSATGAANPLAEDAELVADFATRAREHLDSADGLLLTLEKAPDDREALDATFRVFHTIKGMAGFLGFDDIERFAHDTETFLDGPRKGQAVFSPEAFDAVFVAVDAMRRLIDARATGGTVSPRHPQADAGPATPGDTQAAAPSGRTPSPGDVGPAAERRAVRERGAGEGIVRVDETRLDLLLDTIGELVIAEATASESVRQDAEVWNAVSDRFARLDKITRELQEMATSLRMVPLKATFGRMARLVRDLGQKAGKKVEFVTSGEDTELDKAMVDLISDPLVHLLRNAVDHGLEDAKSREQSGKPHAGTVTLSAYHAGGTVCIEVSDDGRGLDADAVLAKARDLGLAAADATLSERDVHQMIFAPGFSTAKEVTDVSGRGVGMDVVKRAVEGLRGSVEVVSAPGEGTRFTMRLPLTLAIIDGMALRVGDERYIIPTLAVQRSLRPERAALSTLLGRGEMLATDDGMVPLVRLGRLFEAAGADPDPADGIVILVGENGDRAGFVASELLGQQQIVIKPLGDAFSDTRGVSGGAIMPDGTVGLILDVPGLVKLAQSGGGE